MKQALSRSLRRPRWRDFRKPALVLLGTLAVSAAAHWIAYDIAFKRQLAGVRDSASRRIDAAAAQLTALVARFEYLPALLETTPAVMRLLTQGGGAALTDEANETLARINAVAGADMLFVLEPSGRALAAADWLHPDTTVGHEYRYRPYFADAMSNGRGRFFGIGATSRKPGYFLSYALVASGKTVGVATVKIDPEPVERAWSTRRGDVFATDANGVVILASRPEWKFHALTPLSDEARARIATERAYPPDPPLLSWVDSNPASAAGRRVSIEGRDNFVTQRTLPELGWTLHSVDTLAPLESSARNAALVAALGAAVVCLLAMAAWQSRHVAMQKLAAQAQLEAAHASLEHRVTERTAQLTALNQSLEAEVETRRAVEHTLHETQGELVHAAKMAVLGQLSAGLAHELNQPLAAMRTLSDNAVVLLDQQRLDETRGNLQRIAQLVGRLGELTRRLKTFAHKPSDEAVATAVNAAVSSAHALLIERMRRQGIAFESSVEPSELCVQANPALLEQVLVNLIANAIDALAGCSTRRIQVRAAMVDDHIELAVTDSGRGIAPEMLPRLFEAFATSKPRGAGLGLGLMISQRITHDFGGRIRAFNNPEGGATFVVELLPPRNPEAS